MWEKLGSLLTELDPIDVIASIVVDVVFSRELRKGVLGSQYQRICGTVFFHACHDSLRVRVWVRVDMATVDYNIS